jgi:predicted ATP-grasp superfamily ATP-dependent carboligase
LRAIATTTRISPYPEGLLDWLRAVEPAAWMYTGALENYPELVDQMAWVAPLWGNPGDVLARVRSPFELARALHDAGLLFPETRDSAGGLPRDGSWLTKSYRGASGSGVREFDRESVDIDGIRAVCFQKRIAGIPCAAVYAARDGSAVLMGVTRQLIGESWLGSRGFQYAGSIGPLPISKSTEHVIERIGKVLTERFELAGVFGVDMVIDGDSVWTIEVNPRYTASIEIVERVNGIQALAAHAAAFSEALGTEDLGLRSSNTPTAQSPDRSPQPRVHGKAILFAKQDIALSRPFVEDALQQATQKPWPMLADISPAHTPIETGRPILTLFAEGKDSQEVEQGLRQSALDLERQIYGSKEL